LISEEIEETVEKLTLSMIPQKWASFYQSNKTLYPWL